VRRAARKRLQVKYTTDERSDGSSDSESEKSSKQDFKLFFGSKCVQRTLDTALLKMTATEEM
jgi:hypothetical protein